MLFSSATFESLPILNSTGIMSAFCFPYMISNITFALQYSHLFSKKSVNGDQVMGTLNLHLG